VKYRAQVNENAKETIRRCVREEMLDFRGERKPGKMKPFEQNKVFDTIYGVFSGKRNSKRAT